MDPAIELAQRKKLEAIREKLDGQRVAELLARLKDAALGTQNLMPLFIECVESDITLGEICDVLRGVPAPVLGGWGEYVAGGF
ncbi:MAG: methylmalonyl-CoA mutase N-terminal domain [Anaerolineaceae bacterium]|nr:MAG: methylmalonyl-CoA mutase N-terminal domain [Anaerolineaceae bacterium]